MIESTLFEVGIQQILLELLQHPLNGFYVLFSLTLNIDENVIKVYNNENVKFPCQDLNDINLEHSWYISQSKRHHPILKVAIADPKSYLLFIAFSNSHPIVGIS